MRRWIAIAGVTVMGASACSGGEAPPPPPPPPTTAETPVEAPPTTATAADPPIEEPSTPTTAPVIAAPRVPRTLALTYGGGCAIHEGRVSCWGESPREDEDEEVSERPEVQLTGDYVDLAASDTIACATRPATPPAVPPTTTTTTPAPAAILPPAHQTVCFGTGDDIADDVRELEEANDDDEEDWEDDGEELASIELASQVINRAIDFSLGEAGGCVVQPTGPDATRVHCAGSEFEARSIDGVRATEGILEVCVGSQFACGRTHDGHVRCWGENDVGQLGDGLESEVAESATEVRGLEHVLHLGCGYDHACALRDDHTVWCWGDNTYGALGRDPDALALSRTPLRVEEITNAASIAVGSSVSCALFDEGPPRCWGDGDMGRLGDGTTRSSFTPVEATAIGPVRELAFGESHACAVRGDEASREVVCWGLGTDGAIGPRARRRDYAPVEPFAGAGPIARIAVGSGSICALVGADVATAEVRCVGSLGANTDEGVEAARVVRTVERSALAAAPTLSGLVASDPSAQSVMSLYSVCTLDGTHHLTCAPRSTPTTTSATIDDVVSVSPATQRLCILRTEGGVECAPEGTGITTLAFTRLSHLPLAAGLVSIGGQPCVITREDARLVCDGASGFGVRSGVEAFPPPSPDDAGVPAQPSSTPPMFRFRDLANVAQVVTVGGVVHARLEDGRVMRVSQTTAPTQLLDRVLSITEGSSFACARRRGDQGVEAWCWGSNVRGQLARAEASSVPVRIQGLEVPLPERAEGDPPIDLEMHGVLELAARDTNACARLSDGRALCWGSEDSGQLARAPSTLRLRPIVVLD